MAFMLPQDLIDAEAAHEAASRVADQAREVRNDLVRDALADGWTHARISEASGLSRARVGQIAVKYRPARPKRPGTPDPATT